MNKTIITLILTVFIATGCKEEKVKRIRIEDHLTTFQLDKMKELKEYKLGNLHYSYGKFIHTTVGGLQGALEIFTTDQNIIYKMQFISYEYLEVYNDKKDMFINAIENKYNVQSKSYPSGADIDETINKIWYFSISKATASSNYFSVITKFIMTDKELEQQRNNQNQEKANSDL